MDTNSVSEQDALNGALVFELLQTAAGVTVKLTLSTAGCAQGICYNIDASENSNLLYAYYTLSKPEFTTLLTLNKDFITQGCAVLVLEEPIIQMTNVCVPAKWNQCYR